MGTIVAHIYATNMVPPMLAPKAAIKAAAVNVEHLSVHLGADLTATQGWSDKERQEVKDLLMKNHDLITLDDLELGKLP